EVTLTARRIGPSPYLFGTPGSPTAIPASLDFGLGAAPLVVLDLDSLNVLHSFCGRARRLTPFSSMVNLQVSTPCGAASRSSVTLLLDRFKFDAAITDSGNVAATNASIRCFTLRSFENPVLILDARGFVLSNSRSACATLVAM